MKKLLIFIFVFVFANICHAQTKNFSFPEDAVGNYKGILQIDSPRGKQEIPMEFQLIKTDSIDRFEYKLIYSDQPRNYTLIIKDREKGICEVDENNGIILPSRFSGNTLFSFFEVQGNFLSSRFEFHKDKLFFEILFFHNPDLLFVFPFYLFHHQYLKHFLLVPLLILLEELL